MSDPRELETTAQTRRAPATTPAPAAKPTHGDAVRGRQRRTEGLADQERLTSMLGPGPRPNPIFPTGTADLVAAQIQRAVREDFDLSAGAATLLRATELATGHYQGAADRSVTARAEHDGHGWLEGWGHGWWEARAAALEADISGYTLLSSHGRAQQTLTASALAVLALAQRDHIGLELDLTHAGLRHAGPQEASIDTTAVAAERRSFDAGAKALRRTDHRSSAPKADLTLIAAAEKLAVSSQGATAATLMARQQLLAKQRDEVAGQAQQAQQSMTLLSEAESILSSVASLIGAVRSLSDAKDLVAGVGVAQAGGGLFNALDAIQSKGPWASEARTYAQRIRTLNTLAVEAGAESDRQTIVTAMKGLEADLRTFADAFTAAEAARDEDQDRLDTVGKALDDEAHEAGTLAPDHEHMAAVGRRVARVDAARSSNFAAVRTLLNAQSTSESRSKDLKAKTSPRSGLGDIDGRRSDIARNDIFAATASIFGGVVAELDARAATLDRLAPDRG